MPKQPNIHARRHSIPIYDVWVEFVVTDSTERVIKHPLRIKRFGELDLEEYGGMVYALENEFCVVLLRSCLTKALIAHETFHLTHRIMEACEHNIGPDHHEPHAYLCGFLTELIYADLKSWNIRC